MIRMPVRLVPAGFLALALLVCAPIEAAPLDSGRPMIDGSTKAGETPAAREFRAGVQAHLKGDMIAAREKFEAALKLDPNYAPALIGLAGVAQAQGNDAQVERYLQRAERANPRSPDVPLAWGRYYLAKNQLGQAEKAFQKARELAPKAIPPLLELASSTSARPARLRMRSACIAQRSSSIRNNRFAQYGLGIALAATGKREEAIKALEKAAQLTPRDPAPLRAVGRLYLESGEFAKALAAFDRALARQPAVCAGDARSRRLARSHEPNNRRHRADDGRGKAGPGLGRGAVSLRRYLSECQEVF